MRSSHSSLPASFCLVLNAVALLSLPSPRPFSFLLSLHRVTFRDADVCIYIHTFVLPREEQARLSLRAASSLQSFFTRAYL